MEKWGMQRDLLVGENKTTLWVQEKRRGRRGMLCRDSIEIEKERWELKGEHRPLLGSCSSV